MTPEHPPAETWSNDAWLWWAGSPGIKRLWCQLRNRWHRFSSSPL